MIYSFFVFLFCFLGGGGRDPRLLVYRVTLLFVSDVACSGVDPGGGARQTSGICGSGMNCHMDGTETSDTFSLFLY